MDNILVATNSGLIKLKIKKILKNNTDKIFEATNLEKLKLNSWFSEINLEEIDIIILDFPFDSNNKFNLLKHMSTNYSNIVIIIISSVDRREIIMRTFELGVKDYILKPFDRTTLLNKINPFLKRQDNKVNEGKSIFKRNYTSFLSNLSLEINRTTRTKSPLTIQKFNFKKEISLSKIQNVRDYVTDIIRDIDQTYVISQNSFILILPLTDRSGFDTLYIRLENKLKEVIDNLEDIIVTRAITFPEDITEELDYNKIDDYQNQILKELDLK